MRLSKLLGRRLKEQPSDAYMESHSFMLRGGYIRQVGNGIFTLLTPGKRITAKIENILREEMYAIDGQEVLFPVVLPADLWKESGRFSSVGSELVRFKDRSGHEMCLGMTHEEAAVHLARSEAQTYNDYPFMIFQIQTKFRDEPRSRGGLIRVREFTMKDAYSFHTSEEDLERYYEKVHTAYLRIFQRAGLDQVISVRSDSGMMGGKIAHEFMYLSDKGEDSLILCKDCGYKSNLEVAVSKLHAKTNQPSEIQKIYTPGIKDIDGLVSFFNVDKSSFIKSTVFAQEGSNRLVVVFMRGDYHVNEAKLRNLLGHEVYPYSDDGTSGLCLGFIGPYDLHPGNFDLVFDKTIQGEENLICGANKIDHHLKGISMSRDISPERYDDVYKVADGDGCAVCGAKLSLVRGIEVGNIFQLGKKYTMSMNMTYLAADNNLYNPLMGCYGIGVGRLFACLLENHHDEFGPIWPFAVAPWQIHICAINHSRPEISAYADELYDKLSKKYEVVLDERNVGAGVMFADADLLGIPVRIIVSSRNLKNNMVEIRTRDKSVIKTVSAENAMEEIERFIEGCESK